MGDRDLVRNAGSERQVRRAQRRETEIRTRLRVALVEVLATPAGRAVLYEFLREARVYGSVWADHGSRMAYNVGQQDFGHWMLAEALAVDENLVATMEREGRVWSMREERTVPTTGADNEEETQG
jgi:hypothetical protein